MGIRKYNPTTPGRRGATVSDFAELTPGAKPVEESAAAEARKGGRNNQGKITARHRGGGHKRQLRQIDFRRNKDGVPAVVHSIQYDPNRSARIALLHYVDGEKRYILAPEGLEGGRPDPERGRRAGGRGQLPAAVGDSAGHGRPQHRDAARSGRRVVPGGGDAGHAWPPATPIGPRSICPAAKFAACRPRAGPRSARSATPTTWASCWARRDANAGWAAGRTSAARP